MLRPESAGQVRKIAVAMHFEAYNGMGFMYKLRTGFYQGAVKQAWTHMPAKVKYPMAAALVGVLAALYKGIPIMYSRMSS